MKCAALDLLRSDGLIYSVNMKRRGREGGVRRGGGRRGEERGEERESGRRGEERYRDHTLSVEICESGLKAEPY